MNEPRAAEISGAAVFADASGSRVTLTILGYQFKQLDHRHDLAWDANWLIVALTANDGQEQWRATQPALLTWEVAHLIRWLRTIAAGDKHDTSIDFIEPELAFEADGVGDGACLSVHLAYGFSPPSAADLVPNRVRVCPTVAGLLSSADALEAALARLPIRGASSDPAE